MKIGIVCNGPGELWGWARPVICELKSRGHEVLLWLLRCPYASGKEYTAARRFDCRVVPPLGALAALRSLNGEKVDSVIQLGGDIFWGRRLAKKASPLFCYTYGRKKGLENCEAVFTAYSRMADWIDGKATVIGDLVKDAMTLDEGESAWNGDCNGRKIIFLPGSRPEIRRKSLLVVRDVVTELSTICSFSSAVLFPPFADEGEFLEWQNAGLHPTRAGAGVVLREADYVITQPGTNTLEIMHAETNGLVLAPISFLKEIPVSGIGGVVSNIPILGPKLKEFVLFRKLKRLKGYMSLPNRIAEAPLLSELIGDISARDIAEKIALELNDGQRLSYVKRAFSDISRDSGGAAKKLCDAVCS